MGQYDFTAAGVLKLGISLKSNNGDSVDSGVFRCNCTRILPSIAAILPSCMNQAPRNCANRAQPEEEGGAGLNTEAQPALAGRF
jgi:hypothetical protein